MNKWGIKKINGTVGFKEVDLEEMSIAYAKNNNRGYNNFTITQLYNLLILSSPIPPNYLGEHYTLVLNTEKYELQEILESFVVSEHIETEISTKDDFKEKLKEMLGEL